MIEKHIWQSVKGTTEQLRELDMTLPITWMCRVNIFTKTRVFTNLDTRRLYMNVADQSLKYFKDEA